MNKRLWLNRGKTALIALLTLSAIFMFMNIVGYWPGTGSAAGESGSGTTSRSGTVRGTRPLIVAVTGGDGERRGVRCDGDEAEALYERYSAALAEALGSTGEPETVSEEQFQAALSGPCVYFDFVYARPLRVLAHWLGAEMSGEASEHTAARLCLAQEDGEIAFYYIRSRDGLPYRCSTLVSLKTDIAPDSANGAKFAFETDGVPESLDPYTLFTGESASLPTITVKNPVQSGFSASALLEAFEINSFVAYGYTEADGSLLYVEGDATLRVGADGKAVFRQSGDSLLRVTDDGESMTIEKAVDAAVQLISAVTSAYGGDCEPMLVSVSYSDRDNGYTLGFEYLIDGVPVTRSSGQAAEIIVSDGGISEAELLLREYTKTDVTQTALPEKQAAALIAADGGGTPVLCYSESGETATIGWISLGE